VTDVLAKGVRKHIFDTYTLMMDPMMMATGSTDESWYPQFMCGHRVVPDPKGGMTTNGPRKIVLSGNVQNGPFQVGCGGHDEGARQRDQRQNGEEARHEHGRATEG